MDIVGTFLTELAIDPFKLEDYVADPDSILAEAGLSQEQLAAATYLACPDEAARIAGSDWASCQTCSDPGSDDYPGPVGP